MFPTTENYWSLPFVLWVIIAFYAGVVLHELGHAVAGSLAGLRVVACGLGRRRPLLSVRLFRICFFIGYPLSPGLTIVAFDQISLRSRGMSAFVLGGAVANVLTAAGAFGLWQVGLRWP